METENLVKLYNTARELSSSPSVSEDKSLIFELTVRIAQACGEEKEFVDAILYHQYPPIRLTQKEAEYLRAGSLPEDLNTNPQLFNEAS